MMVWIAVCNRCHEEVSMYFSENNGRVWPGAAHFLVCK